MPKLGWFFLYFCSWMVVFAALSTPEKLQQNNNTPLPPHIPSVPPIVPPVKPKVEPDCEGVQVPIPKDCRVFNKSGSQCVWCSIECLGRYHGIKELYEGDSRITKHYTWATGPGEVQRVLSSKYSSVKWKQIQNTSQVKPFIKKYVTEKKWGVGLAIPGHMLNLVHYDEAAGIVKVIDNCGPQALKVQDWSMEKFNRTADGWVLTVIPPGQEEVKDEFDYTVHFPDKLYGLRR